MAQDLSRAQLQSKFKQIFFALIIGKILTTFLWGTLIDKIGRRKVLISSLILISSFIFIHGIFKSEKSLGMLKFLTGLVLGIFQLGTTLASEIIPKKDKNVSIAISLIAVALTLGPSFLFNSYKEPWIYNGSLVVAVIGMLLAFLSWTFIEREIFEKEVPSPELPSSNKGFKALDASNEGIEVQGNDNVALIKQEEKSSHFKEWKILMEVPNSFKLAIVFGAYLVYSVIVTGLQNHWAKAEYESFKYSLLMIVPILVYAMIRKGRSEDLKILKACSFIQIAILLLLPCLSWFATEASFVWICMRRLTCCIVFFTLLSIADDLSRSVERSRLKDIKLYCGFVLIIAMEYAIGSIFVRNLIYDYFGYPSFLFVLLIIAAIGVIPLIYSINFEKIKEVDVTEGDKVLDKVLDGVDE